MPPAQFILRIMSETTVENQVCNACGADVRKDALFCYHCGGELASKTSVSIDEQTGGKLFQENNFERNGNNFKSFKVETEKENREIIAGEQIAAPVEKTNAAGETGLKSAATLRRKNKSIQPKRIEVIWEEHENTPNVWFILVAVFLTIVAAVILFLAIRLK